MSASQKRRELGKKILAAVADRAAETGQLAASAQSLERGISDVRGLLLALGRMDAGYALPQDALGGALLSLANLAQDIEVVMRMETVLARARIDLDKLVEERIIDYGVGNVIRIAQSGPAEILQQSPAPCIVATPGQIALSIPISFESPGSKSELNLTVSLALGKRFASNDVIQHSPSRGLHTCPEGAIAPVFEDLIITEASEEIGELSGVIQLPRLPNLQFGFPRLFAPHFFDGLRQPFFLRRRSRTPFGPFPVARLRPWSDTALRIHPEILVGFLDEEIRKASTRAARVGPPRFIGGNAVDVTIVFNDSGGTTHCGVYFGYELKVTMVIRTLATVRGNQLTIKTFTVSDDYDIRIRPRVLDWLFRSVVDSAEKFIDAFSRGISNEEHIRIPAARRMDVELTSEHLALFIQTRSGF